MQIILEDSDSKAYINDKIKLNMQSVQIKELQQRISDLEAELDELATLCKETIESDEELNDLAIQEIADYIVPMVHDRIISALKI